MDLLVDMFVSYLHIKLVSFEDGDKRIVWSKRFPQSIFIVDSYITEQGAMRGGQVLHVMGAILFIPFAIFYYESYEVNRSSWWRLFEAAQWQIAALVATVLALSISWAFLSVAQVPVLNYSLVLNKNLEENVYMNCRKFF